jgi:Tol biopolymer transport system component
LVVLLFMVGCSPPQVPQYEATPPASAIRIAYVDGESLNIMQVDGTDIALLARNLQPTECAPYYISPDGRWVAYQHAEQGLWVVPTTAGDPIELSNGSVGSVSWFPDSTGVVYALNDDVYAQWLDGSQPPQALAVGGRRYLFPTWSPDGKYIAFLESTSDQNVFNVILIQSDGTGWRTLGTTAPGSPERRLCPDMVAWSPDSTRFLVDWGDPVFAFYVTGGSPAQIGAGPVPSRHVWGPDGRSLIYQDEFSRLWLAKADSSEDRLLTDFPISDPVWSPLDGQIAYVAQRGEDTTLEIINVETGEIRSLTSADNYVESNPRWILDGNSLIISRHVGQSQSAPRPEPISAGVWRVPADGLSRPQRLTRAGAAIQVFAIR